MDDNKIYLIERIVAGLSYPTYGLVGFVWLILGLFTNAKLRSFMQYHIFQSIFLSIAIYLLGMLLEFILNMLRLIPVVNIIVLNIVMFFNSPVLFGLSIIQVIITALLLYCGITAFLGIRTYIPFVSEIIDRNVR